MFPLDVVVIQIYTLYIPTIYIFLRIPILSALYVCFFIIIYPSDWLEKERKKINQKKKKKTEIPNSLKHETQGGIVSETTFPNHTYQCPAWLLSLDDFYLFQVLYIKDYQSKGRRGCTQECNQELVAGQMIPQPLSPRNRMRKPSKKLGREKE